MIHKLIIIFRVISFQIDSESWNFFSFSCSVNNNWKKQKKKNDFHTNHQWNHHHLSISMLTLCLSSIINFYLFVYTFTTSHPHPPTFSTYELNNIQERHKKMMTMLIRKFFSSFFCSLREIDFFSFVFPFGHNYNQIASRFS